MFSTNEDDVKITVGKFFPIAVNNKDVRLTKVTWEKINETSKGMCFYWKMGTVELKDIIFDKNIHSPYLYPRAGENTTQALARFHKEVGNKVRHIMSMYLTKPVLDAIPKSSSLEDFCHHVVTALKGTGVGEVALYLKTVANKNGFATVPTTAVPFFVQRMDQGPCALYYSEWEIKENAKNEYKPGVKEAASDEQARASEPVTPQDSTPTGNAASWPPEPEEGSQIPITSEDDSAAW